MSLFTCTQLNGFKYLHLTLIILFIINHLFTYNLNGFNIINCFFCFEEIPFYFIRDQILWSIICRPDTRPRRAHESQPSSPEAELNSTDFFQNPQNPLRALPVHDVIRISWSNFLSGIFILISLNDTSSPRARQHLGSSLHLTNPCAKRKVLSLTKPKGRIYKTKSLGHYIIDVYSWRRARPLWREYNTFIECNLGR